MAAIHELSAIELKGAYANGELSPVEVTPAILNRIDACEPKLNAMYLLHRESALERAQAAERRGSSLASQHLFVSIFCVE